MKNLVYIWHMAIDELSIRMKQPISRLHKKRLFFLIIGFVYSWLADKYNIQWSHKNPYATAESGFDRIRRRYQCSLINVWTQFRETHRHIQRDGGVHSTIIGAIFWLVWILRIQFDTLSKTRMSLLHFIQAWLPKRLIIIVTKENVSNEKLRHKFDRRKSLSCVVSYVVFSFSNWCSVSKICTILWQKIIRVNFQSFFHCS